MNHDIPLSLYERAIGQKVIEFAEKLNVEEILALVDSEAVRALSKIVKILDDGSVDDPECFRRIEAIIEALRESGIVTSRHDW